MIIITTGILLLVYSVISYTNNRYKVFWGYIFCFIIMGFQSGVIGDFDRYKYSFEHFSLNSVEMEKEEYFWVLVNYTFQMFSSFNIFIIVLSAFECYVLTKFTNRFAGTSRYNFLCALLFFFTFNYMLMQMKALRQGLAIELSLLSLLLIDESGIKKRNSFYAILSSLAAYYSHHSSLILLIIVWGYFLYLKFTKDDFNDSRIRRITVLPFALAASGYVLITVKRLFLDAYLVPILAQFGEERYEGYVNQLIEKEVYSPLLIFYDIIVLYLLGWYYKQADHKMKYLTIAAIIGMFCDLLFFANDSVQRILLYFSICNLVVFPNIITKVDKKYGKLAAWILVAFFLGYALKTSVAWMTDPTLDRFGNYQFYFLSNI